MTFISLPKKAKYALAALGASFLGACASSPPGMEVGKPIVDAQDPCFSTRPYTAQVGGVTENGHLPREFAGNGCGLHARQLTHINRSWDILQDAIQSNNKELQARAADDALIVFDKAIMAGIMTEAEVDETLRTLQSDKIKALAEAGQSAGGIITYAKLQDMAYFSIVGQSIDENGALTFVVR